MVVNGSDLHGRSGRVALPRAKEGIVAGRVMLEMILELRRPLRTMLDERRMVADILSYECLEATE